MVMKSSIEYSSAKLTSIDEKIITMGIVEKFQKDTLIICANEKTELKVDEEVFINVFNKNQGIYIYNGIIKHIIENTIVIKDVRFLLDKERRNNNRINTNISLKVSEVRNISEKTIELSKPILMTCKNLSIRGLLLECKLDIPNDVKFFIELPIENNKIYVETTTKRKYKKDNLYYYGCEFTLKDMSHNNILENFILRNYNTKFFKYYPK
ncbi:UNVERIFIED_ORG: PilZ domain-containing protein [Clostridium botulinum]|nr:pilus assembly protein PilZ [Clostridium botulinum]MBN1042814.1 PilZ domain-containing protein [Clostridium botulinum]MBN1071812.1 PilZ domain-containing protein [Clostridium botulinum]MBN1075081.1 PilZ domain-containing protein [Clostridium botulinum]MBY6809273.1 PilZ domain-containing protein [Clostridium botulinum]